MVVKWNHHFNISERELLKLSFLSSASPMSWEIQYYHCSNQSYHRGIERNTWPQKIHGIDLGRPGCDTGQGWERRVNKAKGQIWILIGEIKLREGLREFWGFLSLAAEGFCKLHLDHSPGLGDGDFADWGIGTTTLQKVPEDFNTKPCWKEKKI